MASRRRQMVLLWASVLLFLHFTSLVTPRSVEGVNQASPGANDGQKMPSESVNIKQDSSEQEMSLVINTDRRKINPFIQLINPPSVIQHFDQLKVEYRCEIEGYVGVDIRVWMDTCEDCSAFVETWTCGPHVTVPLRKTVQVLFPDSLAFKPSFINPKAHNVELASIKLWIVDKPVFRDTAAFKKNAYEKSLLKATYSVEVQPALERLDKRSADCVNWYTELRMQLPYQPQCDNEPLMDKPITFPLVLSGTPHGVYKAYKRLKDPTLEAQRKAMKYQPTFTLVMFVYVLKHCDPGVVCGIIQRVSWNDTYSTPLVLMNHKGNLHIQMATSDNRQLAFLTMDFAVPLKQWVRVIVRCKRQLFEVGADWGPNWNETFSTWYRFGMSDEVSFDDTKGLLVIGGTVLNPAFKGYVGEVVYYRTKAVPTSEIAFPSPYHPMFELELTNREENCQEFFSWVKYRTYQSQKLLKAVKQYRTCPYYFEDVFSVEPKEPVAPSECTLYGGPRPKQYSHVNKIVRSWVLKEKHFTVEDLGKQLYKDSLQIVEREGLQAIKTIVPLLKQASCYSNHDASFLLAAIWSKGVGVKSENILAVSTLMQGALDNNRLCLMALGNKHVHGLDGVNADLEQAFVYYLNVAEKTKWDREAHAEQDMSVDQVRLTDEEAISQQTDEDGDLFHWFKHQAAQGVVHAQQNLGRLLFWGTQGVRRDLRAAAEYYRMGAERNDPQSLHDYGIVLLKGQGVKKNETEAKIYLKRAADLGHVAAMNALGWFALERENNSTKALVFFNESYRYGNADAAFNIGHMMYYGRMPGGKTDKVNCFTYFAFAAARGQLEAGIHVGMMNMRGHPLTKGRDLYIGIDWVRFVSEQNPVVANLLSKGLKAYTKQNWDAALLYYILAAEIGTEIGNFNLAYLCEENLDGVVSHVEKECVWRHYNLSTQRYSHQVDPYSWIKMGDYHWYGCGGSRDPVKAASYYTNAAEKGDPHAIFNLGFLVEEGVKVPQNYWKRLQISRQDYSNNVTLLQHLYSKCSESRRTEAYLPCSIAYFRILFVNLWENYGIVVKVSTALAVVMASCAVFLALQNYFHRQNQAGVDSV